MKTAKIKRLWHGFASIRDYIIKDSIKKREDLKVIFNGQEMTINWDKLCEGKDNKEIFKSKHNDLEYYLIDYLWKPEQSQRKLL